MTPAQDATALAEQEAAAEIIYDCMRLACKGETPAWVPQGNAIFQDAARNVARKVLILRATPQTPDAVRDDTWAEEDQKVVEVAHAIAENGFGRLWDDFLPVNAHDTDQGDLIEYARAAIDAFRATSQTPDAAHCICDTNHPLFKERGHHPHCPVSTSSASLQTPDAVREWPAWTVRKAELLDADDEYPADHQFEVLRPDGKWRGVVAVGVDDARDTIQKEWAEDQPVPPSTPSASTGPQAEAGNLAPLREQIAAVIDPMSFAFDYKTRYKHCSPYKIEYVQQQWFERADAVIALLVKNGQLAHPQPQQADGRVAVIEECINAVRYCGECDCPHLSVKAMRALQQSPATDSAADQRAHLRDAERVSATDNAPAVGAQERKCP